jgi:hypothetical protein
MKKTFGLSCTLLVINSEGGFNKDLWEPRISQFASLARKVAGSCEDPAPIASIIPQSGPYGALMSEQDISRIEAFIKGFTSQNLIPFMERNIQSWNIEVQSRKRGITGKLFSAGRKFFGGGSTAAVVPDTFVVGLNGNHVFIGQSHELLQRKLADYAFMLKDFRFAYSVYNGLHKDIQGNEKTLYYSAGCQEMLGLCTMMVDSTGKGSVDAYYDSAIENYRNVGDFVYETRACMLYYEMLKEKEMHRDAPFILNKMTGVCLFCVDLRNRTLGFEVRYFSSSLHCVSSLLHQSWLEDTVCLSFSYAQPFTSFLQRKAIGRVVRSFLQFDVLNRSSIFTWIEAGH